MRALALLAFVPSLALAEPRIEDCLIDLPATEGAGVMVHSEDGEIRLMTVGQYGETVRQEMDVLPLSDGDAILNVRLIRYSRPIYQEDGGLLEQKLADSVRAVVRDGRICEGDQCFTPFTGELTRESVQDIYDRFLAAFPTRSDCALLYPR